MTNGESTKNRLKKIKRDAIKNMRDSINAMQSLWQDAALVTDQGDTLREIHALSHKISGSGATFGLPSVSRLAQCIDNLISNILAHDKTATQEQCEQIDSFVDTLSNNFNTAWRLLEKGIDINQPEAAPSGRDFVVYSLLGKSTDKVCLDKACERQKLKTIHFESLEQLLDHSVIHTPQVVLIDLDTIGASENSTLPQLGKMYPFTQEHVAIVLLSDTLSHTLRLKASRAGACRLLQKPINEPRLDSCLRFLRRIDSSGPYRVLVVDDDEALCRYYQHVLETAGFVVNYFTHASDMLAQLGEFDPDLLIIDLYMPDWNGTELTGAIRQQSKYDGVPIIYLSRESEINIQLQALLQGGDYFLTKPIQPGHLITMTRIHAHRFRRLRSNGHDLTERDAESTLFKLSPALFEHISHEFRNPLNAILGFTQVLQLELAGDKHSSEQQHLNSIIESGWNIQNLLQEITTLSDIMNGSYEIEMENLDVCNTLYQVFDNLNAQFKQKSVQWHIKERDCIGVYVRADHRHLYHSLQCLALCGLNHTAENSVMYVSCKQKQDAIEISMRNQETAEDKLPQRVNLEPESEHISPAITNSQDFISLLICQSLIRMMNGETCFYQSPNSQCLYQIILNKTWPDRSSPLSAH